MSDRFKDLSEREQRIEMMRRNGEDFRDADGKWATELGDGPASDLVRAIWDEAPDDEEEEEEQPGKKEPTDIEAAKS